MWFKPYRILKKKTNFLVCNIVCYFVLQGQLTKHVVSRVVCVLVLPGILYLLQFYIMLAVLRKTGPHDDMMSSAFQASLEVITTSCLNKRMEEFYTTQSQLVILMP